MPIGIGGVAQLVGSAGVPFWDLVILLVAPGRGCTVSVYSVHLTRAPSVTKIAGRVGRDFLLVRGAPDAREGEVLREEG